VAEKKEEVAVGLAVPPLLRFSQSWLASRTNYGTSGTMVGSYCSFGVKLRKSAVGSEVFVKAQITKIRNLRKR
jgi:hypothetical protein